MGATPTYGLRYQELGDAPHGPDLGRNLADDLEAQLVRLDGEQDTQDTSLADHEARLDTLEADEHPAGGVVTAAVAASATRYTMPVVFPVPFAVAPAAVVVSVANVTGHEDTHVAVSGVTATQFTLHYFRDNFSGSIDIMWAAIPA